MWCYQKPGFEVLLLAELQRQQQCSQFCDTLLKTEGVSVPAHSCILSAISPDISSALSSTPPPPAGQSRLLEFRALGARTLLRVVRLLYSGEMAGEGEEEKQEAISAAARLGIHGLVEVTRRDSKRRHEEEGQQAEVGVQTEPLMQEENEGRRGRWRREVRDGSTFLWKETLSDGERDTWTQTEELEADTAPPPHPAASYETIDIAALQSLGQTHPNLLPPQIPYVPISLVYPLDENQTHQPSSALVAPLYTSASPSHLPFPSQATPSAADPPSCWAGPQRAAAEECEDEQLEQFQDNIPGYINYFLNPNKEEDSRRGRPRRRQGAGVGGARRAGTGERRARRPPAKAGGRGRGGLTQRVDVQEVGVSRLQKLFLQRGGVRASRTGQGGGAAGRKLYLRTRELLKQTKSCQRRRGRSKVWEFSLSGDVPPFYQEGAGNKQRARRSTAPQFNQDGPPVGRAQKARTKPTTSVSFSSPPMQVYNIHTLPASSPSLKPSPSPALLSPAASYASRESSFLHTASVPPPAPPPHEEQPEHFDRLLEEVMMGLDILPNNSNGARHPQLPLSSSSSSRTYGNTLGQNKQQSRNSGLLEAGPGFHGSTQVVAVGGGGSSSANSEVPILQQQGEGELNEMLEHFLMSFEQHVDSSASRDEVEMGGQSRAEAPVRSSQKLQQSDGAETPATQPRKASAHNAAPPEHNEGTPSVSKRRKKQRKKDYLFSLERKRVRVKKPVSSSDAKTKIVHDRGDKQLQQIPVVKLERSGLLPVKVALQGHSCQSLDLKSVAKAKTSSSSVKCPHDSLSGNNQRASWSTKTYPIRSRCREANMDSTPFLEEPFLPKPPPGRKRGRPKKNGKLPSLSNGESSTPPIQPQPVDEQLEKNQEKREEEFTVQPLEEAEGPTRRGEKRGAESKGETSDDATVAKKVCSETPQPTSETCTPISVQFEPAATEIEDVIDVETVSLTGDCLQSEEQEEKLVFSVIRPGEAEERLMDEDAESSGDEIIDVDGDVEKYSEKERHQSGTAPTLCCLTEEKPSVSPPSHSAEEVVLGSAGSWEEDEDIDVIGGSSPVPDPVIISWTESSEGEEEEGDEEVDVIGGKTDYTPSVVLAAISKSELVNGKYQTELRLH